jgi:hypothetical protein
MGFLIRLPEHRYDASGFDGYRPGAFSIGTALAAGWLTQIAYEDDHAKVERVLNKWKLRRVHTFRTAVPSILPLVNAQGFAAEGQGAFFLVFRGTDPLLLADWLTDFDFLPNASAIHQGFDAALDVLWPDILSVLAERPASAELIITGHSLGAALAIVCAKRAVQELSLKADGVYTYGSPRVGLVAFAKEYDDLLGERTYRFVYGHDIVATVPPSALGFRHVGRFLSGKRGGKFDPQNIGSYPSDDPRFDQNMLDRLRHGLTDVISKPPIFGKSLDPLERVLSLLPPPINDHVPSRYWRALQSR